MARKTGPSVLLQSTWRWTSTALGTALFFLAVCLGSAATVRREVLLLIVLALSAAFLFWERLQKRLNTPILALFLVVVLDVLSCTYAISGKFALHQILKVIAAFCLALLLLVFTGKDKPERKAAEVLEGCCAIAGLTSIDLLSTRWISTPVLTVLSWFTTDYMDLDVVEEGVRMTSVFIYPNAFACCMGIGVLLGLGLAVSEERPKERCVHLICLLVNSLSFLLVFSMGACAMIVPAFLVLLALTGRERRTGLLILMVETLAVAMLAAFPISLTSISAWKGVRPVPLLCTIGGAAVLCALDLLLGRRFAAKLTGHGKAVFCFTTGILAALGVFLAVACTFTTGVALQAGESLRRSAYPKPGTYSLAAETDGGLTVTIQSQDRAGTMMHTSDLLYSGPLDQAVFTVPEGSLVVHFNFSAAADVRLESVEYRGESGSGSVPLGYRLLPGFIANRLQGLRANQNAIQRFVFFEDGLKLFRQSPIIGLGFGAYASVVNSVQSFFYVSNYAHSHYIQTLVETGLVGIALFLGLLAVSAAAVWRGRKGPLAPALGAALVFIACHGAVEGIFSYFASMPFIFALFAIITLCCEDTVPVPAWMEKKAVRNGLALGVCGLLVVFGVLLGCNITARSMVNRSPDLSTLEQAAALDPFEWADYKLAYVLRASKEEAGGEIRQKADEYAAQLAELNSNTAPIYLAEYYLETGRAERGLEMAEQYVTYLSSDTAAWQKAFDLLEKYEQDTEAYRAGVARIVGLLDAWNEENLGHIVLDEHAQAFADRMRA